MNTIRKSLFCLRILVIVLVLHNILISLCLAQDKNKYDWPLNVFNGLSGTFQEFRHGHFHAGIDIKTFQKTGYPIVAVSDGQVYKLRVVRRGSGKGLYLKHSDGKTSVYYHLDKYVPALEKILSNVQKQRGKKYIGNYYLKKKIAYKKGDIIAYSGETGVGFPHLHIEIRDENYMAINPFPMFKYPGYDLKVPIIKSAILKPIGHTLINGKMGKDIINFKIVKKGKFYVKQPVLITGPFDVILKTFDVNDSDHRVAPFNIVAYIDDKPYYEIKNERFKRDDNNQLGFVFDLEYTNSSSYFYNLFYQDGFTLEKNKIKLSSLYKSLAIGSHKLKIKVTDYFGNYSEGVIPFFKLKAPDIELSDIKVSDNSALLAIDKLACNGADEIEINVLNGKQNTIFKGNLNPKEVIVDKNLRLKINNNIAKFVEFKIKKNKQVYYKKKYSLSNKQWIENKDIFYDVSVNRNYVYVKIKNKSLSSENILLNIIQGDKTKNISPSNSVNGIYFVFKPLNMESTILLRFSLKRGSVIYSKIQKTLRLIPIKYGNPQRFLWDEFEADFAYRSVREPRVLVAQKTFFKSKFPILSQQFDLAPYNFPFLDTVNYIIKKKVEKPYQVSIFKYNHFSKRWRSAYSIYNSTRQSFSIKVRQSGTYALMRDIFPPRIKFYSPNGKYRHLINHLTVILTDRGKGINSYSIRIKLNGKIIPDEYDPDRSSVKIKSLSALKKGKNILYVKVEDYAKHKSEKAYTFYLK